MGVWAMTFRVAVGLHWHNASEDRKEAQCLA